MKPALLLVAVLLVVMPNTSSRQTDLYFFCETDQYAVHGALYYMLIWLNVPTVESCKLPGNGKVQVRTLSYRSRDAETMTGPASREQSLTMAPCTLGWDF